MLIDRIDVSESDKQITVKVIFKFEQPKEVDVMSGVEPNFALKEIVRCCKSGYIETPSPLIEITKGIDGHNDSDKYCGYLHHRYIIWSDIEKCEMYFLPKYSCIIDNFMELYNPVDFYKIVNDKPLYWNNYFIWKDKQPKITMYKNGINYYLTPENYCNIINIAINTSIKNTEYFVDNFIK